MAHDFSHLVDAVWYSGDGSILKSNAKSAVTAILSSLTPSDLAALLAEKCPGWVAAPVEISDNMHLAAQGELWRDDKYDRIAGISSAYKAMLSAAPKLGDE